MWSQTGNVSNCLQMDFALAQLQHFCLDLLVCTLFMRIVEPSRGPDLTVLDYWAASGCFMMLLKCSVSGVSSSGPRGPLSCRFYMVLCTNTPTSMADYQSSAEHEGIQPLNQVLSKETSKTCRTKPPGPGLNVLLQKCILTEGKWGKHLSFQFFLVREFLQFA